jgi:hypothetical protein
MIKVKALRVEVILEGAEGTLQYRRKQGWSDEEVLLGRRAA